MESSLRPVNLSCVHALAGADGQQDASGRALRMWEAAASGSTASFMAVLPGADCRAPGFPAQGRAACGGAVLSRGRESAMLGETGSGATPG